MPTTHDLQSVLAEIANTAHDVPAMPVVPVSRVRPSRSVTRLLTVVTIAAVVMVAGIVATMTGVTTTQPSPAKPPITAPSTTAADSPSPTPPMTSSRTPGSAARLVVRAMTRAEIVTRTNSCLRSGDLNSRREGKKLTVRYAMVQSAVGYPTNGPAQQVLLLQDDGGYFDCTDDGSDMWVSTHGDSFETDPSADALALPTISGGSTGRCKSRKDSTSVMTSAVALKASKQAAYAHITVAAAGGHRTVTIPVRDGYLYATTQVSGGSAWKPSSITVTLFDTTGKRLDLHDYGKAATDNLAYGIDPCSTYPRR